LQRAPNQYDRDQIRERQTDSLVCSAASLRERLGAFSCRSALARRFNR
jgi:hypothetical protein